MENFLIPSTNAGEPFIFTPIKSKWKKDHDGALEVMEIVSLIGKKGISSQNLRRRPAKTAGSRQGNYAGCQNDPNG